MEVHRGSACDGLKQLAMMIISTGTYWQAGVTAGLSCPRCCDSHHQIVTAVSRAAHTSVLLSFVWMHHWGLHYQQRQGCPGSKLHVVPVSVWALSTSSRFPPAVQRQAPLG